MNTINVFFFLVWIDLFEGIRGKRYFDQKIIILGKSMLSAERYCGNKRYVIFSTVNNYLDKNIAYR